MDCPLYVSERFIIQNNTLIQFRRFDIIIVIAYVNDVNITNYVSSVNIKIADGIIA